MNFADRVVEAQLRKQSNVVLGIDPQLDSGGEFGIPNSYTLPKFCCEVIEACEPFVVAVKLQLAFFEARGLDGMKAFVEVVKFARNRGLLTIADAKRGDISTTAAAYAEAFLGRGDFACNAVCVNPYLGLEEIVPFIEKVKDGRGIFVIVKTSNPSSGEFQDLPTTGGVVWESVAKGVSSCGAPLIGDYGISPVGAVVGATYPNQAKLARRLMPTTLILVPGYGAQGAGPDDAVAAVRSDGRGILVNASRSIMYAAKRDARHSYPEAAGIAARKMRDSLNEAIGRKVSLSQNFDLAN